MASPPASMELQSISKHSDTLDLFTSELPDPEEELFVQHNFDFDTFTPFPKLATELRLKIWRFAFQRPARHISIREHNPQHLRLSWRQASGMIRPGQVEYSDMRLVKKNLPITLCVTQESREETLRHFGVVAIRNAGLRPPPQNSCRLRLPLCVMFGLDSIELEPVHLLRANTQLQNQWLDHIEAYSPTLLQKVERLELKCHYWEGELEINHNAGDLFKRFSGLKVLLLTIYPLLPTAIGFGPDPRQVMHAANGQIRRDIKTWIAEGLRDAGLENITLPRICRKVSWEWKGTQPSFVDAEEV